MNSQNPRNQEKFSAASSKFIEMFEDCIGCKWTLHILNQIRCGVNRPGALVKTKKGLTTKVLNERLAKMVQFRILERLSYPEVPPRVEYQLTPFGQKFLEILDRLEDLHLELMSDL
ncbi:MAG: helix-turn-helix transcriptional regulator [Fischerella sp.]|nr:helix-turn-helix transcriptional regulator [Fischerella sp.]